MNSVCSSLVQVDNYFFTRAGDIFNAAERRAYADARRDEQHASLDKKFRTENDLLLTSLCDAKRYYKAADIAACYTRRWQVETSYLELKQSMLGMELTLRSKTVDGVYQEIWGALTAYNLIRLEIAKAALNVKCEPTEISFTRAFHLIQDELHWAALTRAQGKLPALLQRLRQRLVSLLNEERPGRKFDRAVKALPHRYNVRFLKKTLTERH